MTAADGTARAVPRPTAHVEPSAQRLDAPAKESHRIGPVPIGGLSVGSPTDGHLLGGARVEESPWLRVVPCYQGADNRWGLDALVSLLDHAGRAVRKEFPDSVLSLGHLSRRGGGDLDRHASHESGRDADVGFYVVNERGKPVYADHFVKFLADGTAPSWPGAHFDDARNWAFIAAIVGDTPWARRAHVSHVFVATPLRERLLAYGQRIGAPYAVRVRASEVMAQPHGALPHDDHFHVRISCPGGMEACVEQPTANLSRVAKRGRSHGHLETAATASHEREEKADRVSARASVAPPAAHLTSPMPAAGAPEPPAAADLPALPAPPAALDTPFDDVDGVEE